MKIDTGTIAYIAMGAKLALLASPDADHPRFQCEMDLIGEAIRHAPLLDELFESHAEEFAGVFYYDVAEPFGFAYMNELLDGNGYAGDEGARHLAEGYFHGVGSGMTTRTPPFTD